MKSCPCLLLSSLFLFASCAGPLDQGMMENSTVTLTATGAERPLFNEINRLRAEAGKPALNRSPKLDALAAGESERLARSGSRKADVAALRKRSGYGRVVAMVGSLKDRGPATGTSYPTYWMKNEREKGNLLGTWAKVGVGSAKTADGELVSVVIFGSSSAVDLMSPMW